MNRKTTRDFQIELQGKNPSIEVLGVYKTAREKIAVRCKKCGHQWEATPTNLLRGRGCAKCSGRYRRTHREFVEEMLQINENIEVIGTFSTTAQRVKVRCKKCGNEWNPQASALLQGNGCPKCRNTENAQRFSLGQQKFNDRIRKENPMIEIEGEYNNIRSRIKCQCKKCGYSWETSAGSLLSGAGCPECKGNRKKTTEEFIAEIRKTNPNIEIKGEYVSAKEKIACKCKVCGFSFEMKANNLQQGQRCPRCANKHRNDKRKITQKEFEQRVAILHPEIAIEGRYIDAHQRVSARCKLCGNVWSPLAWDILRGTGCPVCSHTSTSFVEQFIYFSFAQMLGEKEVLSRDTKAIGRELDIYIPSRAFAIEYGSWYWHSKKSGEDKEKEQRCAKSGIRLITIYDSYHQENDPDLENCITSAIDFGLVENRSSLIELITKLAAMVGVTCFDFNWEEIGNKAAIRARRRTTEDLRKKLSKLNVSYEVIGEYSGTNRPIKCRCKKCGYIWNPRPSKLLAGQGCPKCGGHMRKTQEEFVNEVTTRFPELEVQGTYTNNRTNLPILCKKCGYLWTPRPANLLNGKGCPNCRKKKIK